MVTEGSVLSGLEPFREGRAIVVGRIRAASNAGIAIVAIFGI